MPTSDKRPADFRMETNSPSPADPHRFEHEAMATTFALHIHHPDGRYAHQAAMEAFRLCDHLEEELSRFVEYSSISRINRASPNEDVPVNADAYLCLRQALRIAEVTGGAFDVGYRSRPKGKAIAYHPPVVLSEESVSASPTRLAPDLDLGGIGKGYAIDKMAGLLAEWSIDRALIMGGWSTLLAVGTPPGTPGWRVSLPGASDKEHYLPAGFSVSASGFEVRGEHVLDPASGITAAQATRAWSIAPSAAVSDALSTTALVLPGEALRRLAETFGECGFVLHKAVSGTCCIGIKLPILG